MPAINERFKAVRKELDLSQTEYGKKLGLQQGSVGDIERAKDNIGVSEAVKRLLESEYNVNLQWLETGSGEMFKSQKSELPKPVATSVGKELEEIKQLLKMKAEIIDPKTEMAEIMEKLKKKDQDFEVLREKYDELKERYINLLEKVNKLKK